jgi:hypothetical protein
MHRVIVGCDTMYFGMSVSALRPAFDLFDSDGSRVVASALGAFPAAGRSAVSNERSPHYVVERNTYAAGDCAVFTKGFPRGSTPSRWRVRTTKSLAGLLRKGFITDGASWRSHAIAGAAIDAFEEDPLPAEHPFRSMDNVLAIPHIGYVTESLYRIFYGDCLANITAGLDRQDKDEAE